MGEEWEKAIMKQLTRRICQKCGKEIDKEDPNQEVWLEEDEKELGEVKKVYAHLSCSGKEEEKNSL